MSKWMKVMLCLAGVLFLGASYVASAEQGSAAMRVDPAKAGKPVLFAARKISSKRTSSGTSDTWDVTFYNVGRDAVLFEGYYSGGDSISPSDCIDGSQLASGDNLTCSITLTTDTSDSPRAEIYFKTDPGSAAVVCELQFSIDDSGELAVSGTNARCIKTSDSDIRIRIST